jgi:hypothetical protein
VYVWVWVWINDFRKHIFIFHILRSRWIQSCILCSIAIDKTRSIAVVSNARETTQQNVFPCFVDTYKTNLGNVILFTAYGYYTECPVFASSLPTPVFLWVTEHLSVLLYELLNTCLCCFIITRVAVSQECFIPAALCLHCYIHLTPYCLAA